MQLGDIVIGKYTETDGTAHWRKGELETNESYGDFPYQIGTLWCQEAKPVLRGTTAELIEMNRRWESNDD